MINDAGKHGVKDEGFVADRCAGEGARLGGADCGRKMSGSAA
jgi:hypothetical protein